MRAKDLRKYKTLDITELSGSPWNDAEKVLGLDQEDKVIMAEPEETVTPEYVDEAISAATQDLPTKNWVVGHCDLAISAATADLASNEYVDDAINQAMEVETARTEDVYAKKSEVPDLDDYYTKEEVDEAISGITVDLSDYYTKDETDQAISAATQDLASTDYVDDAIAAIPQVDLSGYAKTTAVTQDIHSAIASETARTESTYTKPSDIPSLDGYATEEWVENQGYLTEHQDLSAYAKTTAVTQDIQTAIASETARTESTYLKEHQDISGKLDKTDFNTYTGATETVLAGKLDATAYTIDNTIDSASTNPVENRVIATALNNKPEKANVNANTNSRYFPQWNSDGIIIGKFGNIIYNVGHNINGLTYYILRDKNSGALPTIYAPTSAGTQGQLLISSGDGEPVWSDNNFVTSGDVANQIDASMASETARTESTYLKEHQSLDNYYTKSEVDADFVSAATAVGQAIDAAVQGLASEDYVDNAVSGLASEGYVDAAVTAATEGLASEEYVDNAVAGIVFPDDYATTGDVANAVEGLASESYVNDAITSATEGMATQSDLEGLASESYVDDAVNGVVQGIGMLGMVNDVSESNGTVTVQKTTMQEGQLVTGSTSFNIATPGDIQTAMASETARTESTYLKEHQSLDNYYTKSQVDAEITGATEDMATKTWVGQQGYLTQHQDISGKLDKTDFNTYTGATETVLAGKLDASAYTVDNAIDSASTNPVENRAIYDALYGESASTQLEIIESATTSVYLGQNFGNIYFKETNMPDYLAINLGEYITGNTYFNQINDGTSKRFDVVSYGWDVTLAKLGVKCTLKGSGNLGNLSFNSSNLDGTYNYYLVYNQVDDYVVVYKNLPVITEVTDHSANISDLPVAQDGSDTKYYAYAGDNYKKIISSVYPAVSANTPDSGATRRVDSTISYNVWSSNQSQQTEGSPIPTGNEYYPGLKTSRDSEVIDNAMEALSGLTESITLTLGNQSTDYITFGGQNFYLFETDNPRYLAIPASGASRFSMCGFDKIVLSNTDYYSLNSGTDFMNDLTGVYQLATYKNYVFGNYQRLSMFMGGKYFIIDKELKLFIVSDSLTFTRTKNIPEAISAATQGMVTSGDVATQIGTALTGYATEQWVQNQGYLTQHQSLANYYTKTEIDGMIGDIESLLASI